jgi:hypothetical protein
VTAFEAVPLIKPPALRGVSNLAATEEQAAKLTGSGAELRAVVFGKGSTRFAEKNLIPVHRASSPAELVAAFTDDFRQIVQAPFKNAASAPSRPFEMKRQIAEAWVVVYGDRTLGDVQIDTPGGIVAADYAQDMFPSAGGYKVAHFSRPLPGLYRVVATGGGSSVTYGVVQRSALTPELLEPRGAISGVAIPLVASLRTPGGPDAPASELGEAVTLTAEIEGRTITLHDDGKDGDQTAGDGKYSAMAVFPNTGDVPVKLLARNSFLNRSGSGATDVSGSYRCPGCELSLDFGSGKAGKPLCLALNLPGNQQGTVPFELRTRAAFPPGYALELRSNGVSHRAGGRPLRLAPGQAAEMCLISSRDAPASRAMREPAGGVAVAAGGGPDSQAALRLSWNVRALSFWERWGWLILSIVGVLMAMFVVYGYIKPYPFPPEMAVSFAPEYADLDDQIPQPLKQWRGVGIGFYRDAWACLHSDFRISQRHKSALAVLRASGNRSSVVLPINPSSSRKGRKTG